jgi:hypothetical protein
MFEIPLTDFLKIIAILFAAVGLYLNYWQLRKANNQRRTEIVSNVLWKIYNDKELSEIYYQIEYDEFIMEGFLSLFF